VTSTRLLLLLLLLLLLNSDGVLHHSPYNDDPMQRDNTLVHLAG